MSLRVYDAEIGLRTVSIIKRRQAHRTIQALRQISSAKKQASYFIQEFRTTESPPVCAEVSVGQFQIVLGQLQVGADLWHWAEFMFDLATHALACTTDYKTHALLLAKQLA